MAVCPSGLQARPHGPSLVSVAVVMPCFSSKSVATRLAISPSATQTAMVDSGGLGGQADLGIVLRVRRRRRRPRPAQLSRTDSVRVELGLPGGFADGCVRLCAAASKVHGARPAHAAVGGVSFRRPVKARRVTRPRCSCSRPGSLDVLVRVVRSRRVWFGVLVFACGSAVSQDKGCTDQYEEEPERDADPAEGDKKDWPVNHRRG